MIRNRVDRRIPILALLVSLAVLAAACGDASGPEATVSSVGTDTAVSTTAGSDVTAAPSTTTTTAEEAQVLYPDVLDVVITPEAGGTYRFDVTLASPYDSPDRYADGWRVLAPDGTVLGERPLLHDHASEQPFTRSLDGVEIPEDVTEVTVQGRDQVSGWGGAELTVPVPGR
ncbi:MAG TPA: hypothetical protein ENI86_18570 [Acidimicrobiales bacterium]|nr:hypothetical protein [Acidimicrobiales bacterium]